MTPHEQEELERCFARITDWVKQAGQGQTPVTRALSPSQIYDSLDFSLDKEGGNRLSEDVATYLSAAVATASPAFANQLFSGVSAAGMAGEMLIAATNTTMATFEAAPLGTLIEREVLERMGRLAGFDNAEGTFTSGGSNANHVAMLAAREAMRECHAASPPSSTDKTPEGYAFVSDQAHYSFEMSTHVMGLRKDQLVKVASDDDGRMDPQALTVAMRDCEGIPFFVGATAGTTVRGAFDPIAAIVQVAKKHQAWVHVDAAWGGAALLSSRLRPLIQEVKEADSFSWDAHKLLGLPLMCSAFLTREKGHLQRTHGATSTDYLYHNDDNLDLGRLSLACGRRADALKLWLQWRHLGDEGFAARIDHLVDLAALAARLIKEAPELELVEQPSYLNVCFVAKLGEAQPGEAAQDQDSHQIAIREHLKQTGQAFVNHAQVRGQRVLRMIFANGDATEQTVRTFLGAVVEAAAHLAGQC